MKQKRHSCKQKRLPEYHYTGPNTRNILRISELLTAVSSSVFSFRYCKRTSILSFVSICGLLLYLSSAQSYHRENALSIKDPARMLSGSECSPLLSRPKRITMIPQKAQKNCADGRDWKSRMSGNPDRGNLVKKMTG